MQPRYPLVLPLPRAGLLLHGRFASPTQCRRDPVANDRPFVRPNAQPDPLSLSSAGGVRWLSRPSPSGTPRTARRSATPSRCPVARRTPRGTRAGRSSPSRGRRCRRCAPPATPRRRRTCRWCRPRGSTREPKAQTARTPPHGSRPSVSCSGKTQRLPASRTASSTALPTAMWSAWLRLRPPQVSRKLPVITMSGRWRRTTRGDRARAAGRRTRGCRRGGRRNSTSETPTIRGRLDLLGLADPAALVGLHAVDAGLAAGHHAVDDVLALAGPAGDGGRGAELHVVGVGDDAERALPVLGERFERFDVHAPSMPAKPSCRGGWGWSARR